jgi:protocatechuate 3,4-dioxygenase alpha subunit
MVQPLDYLKETPSQTAGPYVHIGLIPKQAGFDIFQVNFANEVAAPGSRGERIRIEGRVIDGSGALVRDALIELWQANAEGRYNHPADPGAGAVEPGFRGWGRAGTDFKTGVYHFDTIKPGPVPGRSGRLQAPHVNLWITARGINIGLNTRMYFDDEAKLNADDPVLNQIELQARRATLIGRRSQQAERIVYTFDIVLQGANETVFLDI